MILVDVNVLVYAFRKDSERHSEYRAWLGQALQQEPVVGLSEYVMHSVVRIVTHPRIFNQPSTTVEALAFCDHLLTHTHVIRVTPGQRHWELFSDLCIRARAKGNLVSDAYLAALAMENGAEWITTDRDFSSFPGLRWRHPLVLRNP